MEALQIENSGIKESQAARLTNPALQQRQGRQASLALAENASLSTGTPHTYSDLADTLENRQKLRATLQNIRELNKDQSNLRYQIRMHSNSGRLQVALVNYRTGETVEEIPSSKLLEFNSELEKMNGLVMEEQA